MAGLTLGSELPQKLQEEAKRSFVNRYTGDHKPAWSHAPWKFVDGEAVPYPVQFKDDADWLAHTFFTVTAKGGLKKECTSNPTWPNNPELRKG